MKPAKNSGFAGFCFTCGYDQMFLKEKSVDIKGIFTVYCYKY